MLYFPLIIKTNLQTLYVNFYIISIYHSIPLFWIIYFLFNYTILYIIYKANISDTIPSIILKILPIFLYFSEFTILFITPTDVPAIIKITTNPKEYTNISKEPYKILPVVEIRVVINSNTGVEHGVANIPPSIPIKNAINAFFLNLGTLHAFSFLGFITPKKYNEVNISIIDKIMYQTLPNFKNIFPTNTDITPIIVYVIIIPSEKNMLYFKELLFLLSLFDTYPIINGKTDKVHGLNEETIPAIKIVTKDKR